MKKIIAICVCIFLLAACLPLGAFAYTPAAGKTLEPLTSIPDISHLISLGLPSSSVYSKPGATDDLSAADLADLGDIRYGISLIGVKRSLQRPVGAASDGVWSNFNKGGIVLQNGNWSNGTLTWMTPEDTYYNVHGEVGKEDSRYVSLLTYNFGKVMHLEAFGYFTNNWNAFPRAADLYASNDGKEWTIIGKYDGNQLRVDGSEFVSAGAASPEDSLGGTTSVNPLWSLEGTSSQYLRIAIVKGSGALAGANPDNTYDGWSGNPSSVSIATRELVIFGTDPDPENKPVFEPVTPAEPEETDTDAPAGSETPDPTDEPHPEAPTQPATTARQEPAETPGTTDAPEPEKAGCASSLRCGVAALLLGAVVAAVGFTAKRKGKTAR